MTWYADLSVCDYFGLVDESRLLAVGWLERGRVFPTGLVEDRIVRRLAELAMDPWQPVLFLGYHDCDLCAVSAEPSEVVVEGGEVATGVSNIFVPAGELGVLVAPSLILHYIQEHHYRPPDAFLNAVEQCPAMGSPEYLAALSAAGGEGVMQMKRSR